MDIEHEVQAGDANESASNVDDGSIFDFEDQEMSSDHES